jgi:hypothetical protein
MSNMFSFNGKFSKRVIDADSALKASVNKKGAQRDKYENEETNNIAKKLQMSGMRKMTAT